MPRSSILLALTLIAAGTVGAPLAARESVLAQAAEGAPRVARPQQASQQFPQQPSLQVFLMTMGPGSQVWERFGHNAIWIRDTVQGTDLIYNFGMFDFGAPGFVTNFVKGRPLYWLAAFDLRTTLAQYDAAGRWIEVQELALPQERKAELAFALAENARPDNREYRYDYFLDNCSTRIRDALDAVLGGALREHTTGRLAEGNFRWHTQRSISNDRFMYLGILAGLGPRVDQPIDQWEEMFLPAKVQERVRELRVVGEDGLEVPLVLREATLLPDDTWQVEATPPDWSLRLLAVGSVLALAILSGLIHGGIGVPGRVLAGAWGTFVALGGALLLFLWLATNHVMTAWNHNLLLLSPFAIAVPWLLVRRRGEGWRRCALLAALLAVLGTTLAVAGVGQHNREIAALTTPATIAAVLVAVKLIPRRAGARR